MTICAVLGAQWGDEGKGKLVDLLADKFDGVARFNGGANAGHTIVVDGVKYALHLLPCGVLYPNKVNVIGNGTVIHIPSLLEEMKMISDRGADVSPERIRISARAHILFDFHQIIDGSQEKSRGANGIGTTKRGIGPCYSIKASRDNLRLGDLVGDWASFALKYRSLVESVQKTYHINYHDAAEEELKRFQTYRNVLSPYITDTVLLMSSMLRENRRILAEGANAALLDLDFGTYPFVTSSTTTSGGVCVGLGVPPRAVQRTIGVVKAYTTRVGSGPFPTELNDETGETLRRAGHEFGTTTGRPRRCGWLDIPLLKYSQCLNGYDDLNVTKLDVLTGITELLIGVQYLIDRKELLDGYMPSTIEELGKVRVHYETLPGWSEDISSCRTKSSLPEAAQRYLSRIEELLGVPISYIGVGPGRHDMIVCSSQSKQC